MGVNFSAYFKFMSCVLITFSFKTRYLMILFFPSENKKNTEKSMHNAWNSDFSEHIVSIQWTYRNVSVNWKGHFHPVHMANGDKKIICVLFTCLVFFETLDAFYSFDHYRWKVSNFDLCSAPTPIQQWEFYSMTHLLLHRTYVYNGHLREPVTLTPIAKRLIVE